MIESSGRACGHHSPTRHTYTCTLGCVIPSSQVILCFSSSWREPTVTFRSNRRLESNLRCFIFLSPGMESWENLPATFLWNVASVNFLRPFRLGERLASTSPLFQVSSFNYLPRGQLRTAMLLAVREDDSGFWGQPQDPSHMYTH